MMSFTYITDYIRSNVTKVCNLTGQITCNIIKISNTIYYVINYNESGSTWYSASAGIAFPSVQTGSYDRSYTGSKWSHTAKI